MSNNKRYFDVSFKAHMAEEATYGIARLSADDPIDAILQAMLGEVSNVSESEVIDMFKRGDNAIKDGEGFIYKDFTVVELYPTKVTVFGEEHVAYLPKPCVAAHIGYGTYYQK